MRVTVLTHVLLCLVRQLPAVVQDTLVCVARDGTWMVIVSERETEKEIDAVIVTEVELNHVDDTEIRRTVH